MYDDSGNFLNDRVKARYEGDFPVIAPDKVDLIDIATNQIVSVAASLIPFLENDDANRALMGANMQRQAVPLLRSRKAVVGTGMEKIVACDSGAVVIAKRSGVVEQVDASQIVVRSDDVNDSDKFFGIDVYKLMKYQKSNKSTCMNQQPIVNVGDRVEAGDVIADGTSTENGELALGKDDGEGRNEH